MALFSNSEQNIIEALKQSLSPIGAEMKDGIASIKATIESLAQSVEALKEENMKLQASVSLKKHQLEDDVAEKSSQKAAEIVSGMGHKAVADNTDTAEEKTSVIEQYMALTGAEQRKFYELNKDKLIELCK